MDPNSQTIQSPCISQCCLDEDDICLGCKRHIDEITGWHSADYQQRLEILKNIEQRKQAQPPGLFDLE